MNYLNADGKRHKMSNVLVLVKCSVTGGSGGHAVKRICIAFLFFCVVCI